MKKRTALLLEVLISLSLTAILLTFLFRFFVESARVEHRMDQAREQIVARAHTQTRLQKIFSLCSSLQKEKNGVKLVFDNGLDPDPQYSGILFGHLFWKENRLFFETSPSEEKKSLRRETLLQKVDHCELTFFDETFSWTHEWPKGSAPVMIRMTVKQGDEELLFAFLLPKTKPIPTYLEKKT